jgi:hypothetical protein
MPSDLEEIMPHTGLLKVGLWYSPKLDQPDSREIIATILL